MPDDAEGIGSANENRNEGSPSDYPRSCPIYLILFGAAPIRFGDYLPMN